ncbi:SulP family inorganic anion transporter [Bauldia sp.]|uniref:SulP family inorganic anion transporter n=1 Tax=Bauldia sp. TaxID=2575872 RepID=UPI003BA8DEFC
MAVDAKESEVSAGRGTGAEPYAGTWMSIVVAGLICGILAVVLSIGVGSLLFSRVLPQFLPISIGLGLAATTVIAFVVALTSSIRGAVAPVQEVPVVALAGVVAVALVTLPAGASSQTVLATAIVTVAMSSVLSGIAAFVLGRLNLGALIRYVPYPVIGGFLAATGWFVVIGGLGLLVGEAPRWDNASDFLVPSTSINLCLAVVLFAALVAVEKRASNAYALPGLVIGALIAFNLVVFVGGIEHADLHEIDWLVSVPVGGVLWPHIDPSDLVHVDWSAVAVSLISMPIMVLMTIIALLLNVTGIELAIRRDVDLDRELRSVGSANVLAGAIGGVPGFPAVSLTLLARHLGAPYRAVGVLVAGVTLTALIIGEVLLDAVPTFLLAGLLMWIGGGLLVEWLVRSWQRLDIWDYAIIVAIFAVIVVIGFAEGMIFGLIAAVILFVVRYGQVNAVRVALTGRELQSSTTSEERQRLLTVFGDRILIIRLQGFLFFGTADRLRAALGEQTASEGNGHIRFVVIDFARVTGIDSSTISSFTRLTQIAEQAGFRIVLSGLSPALRETIERSDVANALTIETDVDAALKRCEDALLAELKPGFSDARPRPIAELLGLIVGDADTAERLIPYLTRKEVPAGTILVEEGAASDDIFMVESGHAAVEAVSGVNKPVRLARIGPGAIVGELAYYLREPRAARVTSEEDMVVWRLSREALERLRTEAPADALRFHESMAAMLSRRLVGTNRVLTFLAD